MFLVVVRILANSMAMNTSADKEEPSNTSDGASGSAGKRRVLLPDNRIDSRDLFVGTREIAIVHGEETYRLRLTAQNKLILTK
jgi:hemin uptake protein HemP